MSGDGVTVTTPVAARLTWDYEGTVPRLLRLYEQGKQGQWDAATGIDWSLDVGFGRPLPPDSPWALSTYASSPLAAGGPQLWDAFRWEFQAWMVSQFLHGEQGAMLSAARLVEVAGGMDAKAVAAVQVGDEARHVEVFSRYLREHVAEPYPVSPSLEALLTDTLDDRRWDVTTLGMQILVEALAMAAFRLADRTFHDGLIRQIARRVAEDEARHVAFGVLTLEGVYAGLGAAERAEREEFVLEAAHLVSRRFLLEDVWERLGVPRGDGVAFARSSALMVAYRQLVFAKVVRCLDRVGLLTDRVRGGLEGMDLLAPSARAGRARRPGRHLP